jgi:LPXTG-motif cell wall-anchored protein
VPIGENGGYVALSEEGVPLGEWKWDDEADEFSFDEYVPLTMLPQTGLSKMLPLWIASMLSAMLLAMVSVSALRKQKD